MVPFSMAKTPLTGPILYDHTQALTQEPVREVLGGTVEMDETYIGGKLRVVPTRTGPENGQRIA